MEPVVAPTGDRIYGGRRFSALTAHSGPEFLCETRVFTTAGYTHERGLRQSGNSSPIVPRQLGLLRDYVPEVVDISRDIAEWEYEFRRRLRTTYSRAQEGNFSDGDAYSDNSFLWDFSDLVILLGASVALYSSMYAMIRRSPNGEQIGEEARTAWRPSPFRQSLMAIAGIRAPQSLFNLGLLLGTPLWTGREEHPILIRHYVLPFNFSTFSAAAGPFSATDFPIIGDMEVAHQLVDTDGAYNCTIFDPLNVGVAESNSKIHSTGVYEGMLKRTGIAETVNGQSRTTSTTVANSGTVGLTLSLIHI